MKKLTLTIETRIRRQWLFGVCAFLLPLLAPFGRLHAARCINALLTWVYAEYRLPGSTWQRVDLPPLEVH
jgi:hypothetical protein